MAPPGGTVPTAMTDTPTGSGPVAQPVGRGALSSHGTGRTRISAAWIWVIAGAVVLALLLVFILQNTRSVKVSFFTANGTLPLGVALLLATIGGLLLAGVVASLRIWQLRHRLYGQSPIRERRARKSRWYTTTREIYGYSWRSRRILAFLRVTRRWSAVVSSTKHSWAGSQKSG